MKADAMERMFDRLLKAHTAEIGLMLQNSLWGMWLLVPHQTTSGPGYALMREIMPEAAWGGVSLALGLFLTGARLARCPGATSWALLLSCLWWAGVAVAFGLLNVMSTAVPTYTAIALTAAISYLKANTRE